MNSGLVMYEEEFRQIAGICERLMYFDLITYLPDDILVKVDRASMGVSLEARVPLLDHRVIEFAASLPIHMKTRDGQGKWLLRRLLDRYVPRELVERPKQGFSVPIHAWLRGPLRAWVEELLDEGRLKREGYLKAGPIREIWKEHLAGRVNCEYRLWAVLMFQSWIAEQQTSPSLGDVVERSCSVSQTGTPSPP